MNLSFFLSTLIFLSIFLGQSVKIGLSDSFRVTVMPLDIAMGISFLILFYQTVRQGGLANFFRNVWNSYWRYLLLFLIWAAISLAANFYRLSFAELFVALSYLIRFSVAGLLAMLFSAQIKNQPKTGQYLLNSLLIWGAGLVIVGFIILRFFPDFSFMAQWGWDPHQSRMLSTFFDPNYFGAFLVILMSVLLGNLFFNKNISTRLKYYESALFILAWTALYLTYSRSAWFAGLIAIILITFRKSWKLAILFLVLFISVIFVPNRLGNRISEVGQVVIGNQADKSAAARGVSIMTAIDLAKKNWLVGVGYNAYGAALLRENKVTKDFLTSHTSQGSDSSLLNVLTTTGVIGLGIYLIFAVSLYLRSFYLWREGEMGGILFGLLPAMFGASFFNNTLFYTLILIPILLVIACTIPLNKEDAKK